MPAKSTPAKGAPAEATFHARMQEIAIAPTAAIEVDEINHVLKNVHVLGRTSRNRADYTDEALDAGVNQYEEAQCFVGHSLDGSNPTYDRSLGVHRNVHRSTDGLRGDFHYNPHHRLAEQLVYDAKNNPRACAFSHDADCTYTVRNGRKLVTSVDRVYSVDLVTRGGTTRGLSEEEEIVANDPKVANLAETCLPAIDNVRSIIFAAEGTPEEKHGRIAEALREWQCTLEKEHVTASSAPAAGSTLKEEEITTMGVEYKDLTVEALTKECPDLVARIKGTDEVSRLTEEAKAMKATNEAQKKELDGLKAKAAATEKADRLTEALKTAEFPVGNDVAFSPLWKGEMLAADEKTWPDKIADRKAIVGIARVQEEVLPSPLADLRPAPAESPLTNDPKAKRFFG